MKTIIVLVFVILGITYGSLCVLPKILEYHKPIKKSKIPAMDSTLIGKKAVVTDIVVFAIIPNKANNKSEIYSGRAYYFHNHSFEEMADSLHLKKLTIMPATMEVCLDNGKKVTIASWHYDYQKIKDTVDAFSGEPIKSRVTKK